LGRRSPLTRMGIRARRDPTEFRHPSQWEKVGLDLECVHAWYAAPAFRSVDGLDSDYLLYW
jgi:hypothetical protein